MMIKQQTDFLWVQHISYFRILIKEKWGWERWARGKSKSLI